MNMFTRPPKTAATRVRLVTGDAALKARLVHDFGGNQWFALEATHQKLSEVAQLADLRANCAVLVVDLDHADNGEIAALELISASSGGTAPVIVISNDLEGETARRLLQLRVADWLPRRATHVELQQACDRAVRAKEASGRTAKAKCFAFYPALGGVGNTTISAAVAFMLAGGKRERRSVCLIDLDLQSGTLAEHMDLQPNIQFDDIADTPDRLDDHLLEMLLSRHSSGVAMLAAPNSLNGFDAASPELIERMLDLAAGKFENVVIDLPRVWLPWSESVLRGSDSFFVVTELSVPGLRQAKRVADELEKRFDMPAKGRVIVNKVGWLGSNGVKKKDADDVLGERLAGFVSEAGALASESRNRGVPLSELKQTNRVQRDLTHILGNRAQ